MAANLGGVIVDLKANTAGFVDGMSKAVASTKTTAGAINKILAGVNTSFKGVEGAAKGLSSKVTLLNVAFTAVATGGLVTLARKSLKAADDIGDLANSLGITTDQLQELNYVAMLGGVSSEGLASALNKLNKSLGDARDGGGGLVDFLKDYDRSLLSQIQQTSNASVAFDILANAMSKEADATKRRQLATAAFGKGEINLINTLMQTSEALDEQRRKAHELGLVIDESLIVNAGRANDQLDTLGRIVLTKVTAEVVKLAPTIENLTTRFIDGLPTLIAWVDKMGQLFGLIKAAPAEQLKEVTSSIEKLNFQLANTGTANPNDPWVKELEKRLALQRELRDSLIKTLEEQKAAAGGTTPPTGGLPPVGGYKPPVIKSEQDAAAKAAETAAQKAADAAKKNAEEIQKLVDKTNAETDSLISLSAAQLLGISNYENMKKQLEAEKEVRAANVEITDQQTQQIVSQILANQALEESIKKNEEAMKQLGQFATDVGNRVSSAFEDAVFAGNSLRETISALLQDIARMIFQKTVGQGIANAVSGAVFGGMGNIFGAGGGLTPAIDPYSANIGSLSTASATGLPGFATGGSFKVGGNGGTDSQVVAFRASPNETVSVQTPSQQGGDMGAVYNMSFNIDARSSSMTPEQFKAVVQQAVGASMKQVADANRRNPKYLNG